MLSSEQPGEPMLDPAIAWVQPVLPKTIHSVHSVRPLTLTAIWILVAWIVLPLLITFGSMIFGSVIWLMFSLGQTTVGFAPVLWLGLCWPLSVRSLLVPLALLCLSTMVPVLFAGFQADIVISYSLQQLTGYAAIALVLFVLAGLTGFQITRSDSQPVTRQLSIRTLVIVTFVAGLLLAMLQLNMGFTVQSQPLSSAWQAFLAIYYLMFGVNWFGLMVAWWTRSIFWIGVAVLLDLIATYLWWQGAMIFYSRLDELSGNVQDAPTWQILAQGLLSTLLFFFIFWVISLCGYRIERAGRTARPVKARDLDPFAS